MGKLIASQHSLRFQCAIPFFFSQESFNTSALNLFLFLSGSTKTGSTNEISTIVGVAAGIAVPIFIMCILVMVIICWIQKRQQRRQAEIKRTEAEMLEPLEEEALIPTGQTLKDLIDMSTGTMIYSR